MKYKKEKVTITVPRFLEKNNFVDIHGRKLSPLLSHLFFHGCWVSINFHMIAPSGGFLIKILNGCILLILVD